jgi:hypothetical protein
MKRLIFLLAFRAKTEEFQAVMEDFIPRLATHLLAECVNVHQFGIHDFLALHADRVRVRCRIEPVVVIAPIREAQLQNLVELLE